MRSAWLRPRNLKTRPPRIISRHCDMSFEWCSSDPDLIPETRRKNLLRAIITSTYGRGLDDLPAFGLAADQSATESHDS